jgi:hypothetical protein
MGFAVPPPVVKRRVLNCLHVTLCALVSWQPAVSVCSGESSETLNVIVVEGDGVINDIEQSTTRQAVVRVEDSSGAPVRGVAVAFTLPSQGATAVFSDGSKLLATLTKDDGTAVARIMKPSGVGSMAIRVNASRGGSSGSAQFSQVNMIVPKAKGSSKKWIAAIALIGGVGAGAFAYARTGRQTSSGGSAAAPISITPGAGIIGPPQ